jgi:hypothetical protein
VLIGAAANALHAADAWRLGGHGHLNPSGLDASPVRPLRPFVVAVLLAELVATAFVSLRSVADNALEEAETNHANADCAAAAHCYDEAIGDHLLDFTLHPDHDEARFGRESCVLFLDARHGADEGRKSPSWKRTSTATTAPRRSTGARPI